MGRSLVGFRELGRTCELLTVPDHEILKVTGPNKADLSLPSVPSTGPMEDHRAGRQGGLLPSGSPFHFS